jgi:hypothetical protein
MEVASSGFRTGEERKEDCFQSMLAFLLATFRMMNESTDKEELFVEILNNVEVNRGNNLIEFDLIGVFDLTLPPSTTSQEYLELQKLLHSKLREGYLSVSKARISGALPPSPSNIVTLHQLSSAAADQQQPKWELSTNYTGKPTTASTEEKEVKNDTIGNSFIQELAAKYGCETDIIIDDYNDAKTNTTTVTSKHKQSNSDNIEKKAVLISPLAHPSLKQAESDFNQALHLLVHMANLQYRVKSQLQSFSPSL